MSKRENRLVKNIKMRIASDMRGISSVQLIIPMLFSLTCGIIVIFGNMNSAICTVLIFPRFTPPLFFLTVFRLIVYALLGLAFGILMGGSMCERGTRLYRYSVTVVLLLVCEILWINLLYCVSSAALCFICALFMLLYTVYLLLLVRCRYFTFALILYLYIVVLILRAVFSLFLIGLN